MSELKRAPNYYEQAANAARMQTEIMRKVTEVGAPEGMMRIEGASADDILYETVSGRLVDPQGQPIDSDYIRGIPDGLSVTFNMEPLVVPMTYDRLSRLMMKIRLEQVDRIVELMGVPKAFLEANTRKPELHMLAHLTAIEMRPFIHRVEEKLTHGLYKRMAILDEIMNFDVVHVRFESSERAFRFYWRRVSRQCRRDAKLLSKGMRRYVRRQKALGLWKEDRW